MVITDDEIGKGLTILKVIWFAMFAMLAVYLIVGLQFGATLRITLDADVFTLLKSVFYVLAVVLFVIIRYIRKFILSSKGRDGRANKLTPTSILQKYTVAMIVALALSESIGIYGLILFFIGKDPMDLYLLILISAVAMLIYRPQKEEVILLSREIGQAGTHIP
ncbi:MAG: hypothetical protein V2B19_21520 [Pseudomonadota bacterium]